MEAVVNINKHFDWSYLLLCPFFAVAFIPWFKYHIQFRLIFPLMLLWLIIGFFKTKRQIKLSRVGNRYRIGTVAFFSLYYGLDLIMIPFGLSDGMKYVDFVDLIVSLFAFALFDLSIRNGRMRELRFILVFSFVCIAAAAVMSLRGGAEFVNSSRMMTAVTAGHADLNLIAEAKSLGIGGYGFVYSMGLLAFPLLFFSKFMSLAMKSFCVGFVLVILVAVYFAGFTTLMLCLFVTGLYFILVKFGLRLKSLKFAGFTIVVVFVTVVAFPKIIGFAGNLFHGMAATTGKDVYEMRLDSIADAVSGSDDAYAVKRSELYWKSWRVFLKHPFLGVGKYDSANPRMADVGGHSLVFDLLAYHGLFGLSLLILFVVYHYYYMREMSRVALGYKWWPAYYLFLVPACIIATINTLGGYLIFTGFLLLVPGCVSLFKKSAMPIPQPLRGNARIPIIELGRENPVS